MPRLHTIGKVEVRLYFKDTDRHKEPHFHAVSPDEEILISIPGLRRLEGELKGKSLDLVLSWAQQNGKILVEEWNRCNPHQPARVEAL